MRRQAWGSGFLRRVGVFFDVPSVGDLPDEERLGSGGARVYGVPGGHTRKMRDLHYTAGALALLGIWFLLGFYVGSLSVVLSYGISASLVMTGVVVWAVGLLGVYRKDASREKKHAHKGAVSEEMVGGYLEGLPKGYFVIHGLDTGRGDVDHVLVGPKGVFVIDTKAHRGNITFDGRDLLRNGEQMERDLLGQANAEAAFVARVLEEDGLGGQRPYPVIVFTDAYVRVRGLARGVFVTYYDGLHRYIGQLPRRMSAEDAERAYGALLSRASAAAKPAPAGP